MRQTGKIYEIPDGVNEETVAIVLRAAKFDVGSDHRISVPGDRKVTCVYIGEIKSGTVTTDRYTLLERFLAGLEFK